MKVQIYRIINRWEKWSKYICNGYAIMQLKYIIIIQLKSLSFMCQVNSYKVSYGHSTV
jgi:hypothetical protein